MSTITKFLKIIFKVYIRSSKVINMQLVYLKEWFWDTDLNKSDDFLLDPFCIYNIYAMFWFVFSVKNYTNKILFKLKEWFSHYVVC